MGRVIEFPNSYRGRTGMTERERPLAYRLNKDGSISPCSVEEWSQNFEAERGGKRIRMDDVNRVRVSTIFFGVDTALTGPPMVFETMIFGGAHDRWTEKTSTLAEAEQAHATALAMVKGNSIKHG